MRILLVLGMFVVSGCLQEIVPAAPAATDDGGSGGGVGGNGSAGGTGSGGGPGSGSTIGDMAIGSSAAGHDLATGPGDMGGGGTSACIAPGTPTINGNHHRGEACLGCHNGSAAKLFYAAGTVYDGTGQGAPGVTVEVNDGKNTVRVVTANTPVGTEGNFWIDTALGTTLKVRASSCPADRAMPGNASGDCNSCHGASMQIHLP